MTGKRLYHNSSYLLKTKGTERGLKALIACYGIPETVLHVKEFGGPLVDKTSFRTFSYQKESNFTTNTTGIAGSFAKVSSTHTPADIKTWQFRSIPAYNSSYHDNGDILSLLHLSGSAVTPGLGGELTFGISQSLDNSKINSASFAHIIIKRGIVETDASLAAPLFNGKPWNFSVTIDSGSSNDVVFYATQTSPNKNTYAVSASLNGLSFINHTQGTNYTFNSILGPTKGSVPDSLTNTNPE